MTLVRNAWVFVAETESAAVAGRPATRWWTENARNAR